MPDLSPEQQEKLSRYEIAFIQAGREFLAKKLGGAAVKPILPDAILDAYSAEKAELTSTSAPVEIDH